MRWLEIGLQLIPSNDIVVHPYRELLGRLMYLMVNVPPDICYAVGYLERFQQNPDADHWVALKRVLTYLKNTTQLTLQYKRNDKNPKLIGYVDADWASNIKDRKSTNRYVFYVYGCIVSRCSKKQTTAATSPSEAEYVVQQHQKDFG